jgi:hypothetical protein
MNGQPRAVLLRIVNKHTTPGCIADLVVGYGYSARAPDTNPTLISHPVNHIILDG